MPNTRSNRTRRENNITLSSSHPHPLAAALHTLSPCAVHYLQALEDPFNLTKEACIPDLHAVNSKKVHVLTRGTFSTSSTTGLGWVLLNPWCNNSTGTLVLKTSPTYAGSTATIMNSGTGVDALVSAKFPYTSSEIATGLQHRVVGVGLRVRYSGIELYKGGRAVMLRSPDNVSLLGAASYNTVVDYAQAKTFPVTTEWTEVVYKPVKPSEYEYSNAPAVLQGETTESYTMCFAVSGTAGPTDASAIFEFEVISHVEYVGRIDSITLSHSDVMGMSMIRNVTMSDRPTRHSHKRLMNTLTELGSNVMKTAAPMVVDSVRNGEAHGFLNTLMRQGRNAIKYLSNVPAQIERGAMSTLRRTFSGGLLESLAPALELLAL